MSVMRVHPLISSGLALSNPGLPRNQWQSPLVSGTSTLSACFMGVSLHRGKRNASGLGGFKRRAVWLWMVLMMLVLVMDDGVGMPWHLFQLPAMHDHC